jgi:DNA (cytosine-5)-methyltransferase 1
MEETRGTLFWDILRILEAKRPRFVLLENVRNLAGPRQRETWLTIIRELRSLGYQVSGEPLVLSPHLFSPDMGGRPQVRERVFIVGRLLAPGSPVSELEVPALEIDRSTHGWDPRRWRIDDWLQDESQMDNRAAYELRLAEVNWINTWNELLAELDAPNLPGFPIWADAFVDRPRVPGGTPKWKRDFLMKNSQLYVDHRRTIDNWLRRHHQLRDFPPSRRKLEWQAQGEPRDLWRLVIQFRPSGIRVKRADYLPALVAIAQTSIIGWRRRRITPREAARLQGFPDDFELHPVDKVAYRQLGNAVSVGLVAHIAQTLQEKPGGTGRQMTLALQDAVAG